MGRGVGKIATWREGMPPKTAQQRYTVVKQCMYEVQMNAIKVIHIHTCTQSLLYTIHNGQSSDIVRVNYGQREDSLYEKRGLCSAHNSEQNRLRMA